MLFCPDAEIWQNPQLQTTTVYLELVADPGGFMERVP